MFQMKPLPKFVSSHWEKLFLLVVILGVLLPISPLNMRYTDRDSGVFLYVGWRILCGELPYRDVWDHKPPVIFYLNAVGLAIAGGSRWGVWLLELLGLFFATYFGYKIIRGSLGVTPAILSTLLWLLTLTFLIKGGNLTTEYTLTLQFIALWIVKQIFDKRLPFSDKWGWFLIGFFGGFAFFTKQTAIGIWISIVLFLIVHRLDLSQARRLISELLLLLGGFVTVCFSWILFFGLEGGLVEFWNAAFLYNFIYSSEVANFLERIKPIQVGASLLSITGLLPIAGIGYIIGFALFYIRRDSIRDLLPLLGICLFDLPIEFILVSSSGRTYQHYYMTLLPALAFFSGITFWILFSSLVPSNIPSTTKYLLTIGICGIFLLASSNQYKAQIMDFTGVNQQEYFVNRIVRLTGAEDKVLLWGAEAALNFFSRRQSPTRFVYQYPLYTSGYTNEQMILEFLDSIVNERPRLIIDTQNPKTPMYDFPIQTPAIEQRLKWLQCHYHPVGTMRSWTIYKYRPKNCSP